MGFGESLLRDAAIWRGVGQSSIQCPKANTGENYEIGKEHRSKDWSAINYIFQECWFCPVQVSTQMKCKPHNTYASLYEQDEGAQTQKRPVHSNEQRDH